MSIEYEPIDRETHVGLRCAPRVLAIVADEIEQT
jgi:hypothetical protein